MAKTKPPAAMDDDTFMLEEMRLRLECLRLANKAAGTDSEIIATADRFWRFIQSGDPVEARDDASS